MPETNKPDEEVVLDIDLNNGVGAPKQPGVPGVFTLTGGRKLMPEVEPGVVMEGAALERYLYTEGTGVTAAFESEQVVAQRVADVAGAVSTAGLTGPEEQE